MSIAGITVEQGHGHALCIIEHLSDELKELIRSELSAIAYGADQSDDSPDMYSYANTLKSFLERYQNKTEDTQKGMIGELLSHLLMPVVLPHLVSLSVYFNKEEKSIKKGFDIVYLNSEESSIWYSEVKSGARSDKDDSDSANSTLLGRAHTDLKDKFLEGRNSLWETALIDVTLVLGSLKSKSVKALLSEDSPIRKQSSNSADKCAILVSVLYECPTNPCSLTSVKAYLDKVVAAKDFKAVVLFSIQKKTFERVAEFLETEVSTHG